MFLQASTTCLDSNYRCERLDLCSEQMYMFEYLSLGKTYDPFKLTFFSLFFFNRLTKHCLIIFLCSKFTITGVCSKLPCQSTVTKTNYEAIIPSMSFHCLHSLIRGFPSLNLHIIHTYRLQI